MTQNRAKKQREDLATNSGAKPKGRVDIRDQLPKAISPLKAIRLKCRDCTCDQREEIRLCTITQCPLYPFRLGHSPGRKGIGGQPPHTVAKEPAED
jgi:hypothetical protein